MKTHPDPLAIGSFALDFELPATDGKTYKLSDFGGAALVYIQGCNHCPYVLAYLERLKTFHRDYWNRGVDFVMVNSNDAASHPEDSFENMQAFASEHMLTFPYLYDESQKVARRYRTFRTPELLLFDKDRRLVYHGRIDDNVKEPEQATTHEFKDALEAILAGDEVSIGETYAVGCTIKWKPGNEPTFD